MNQINESTIDAKLIVPYIDGFVGRFFKIIPLSESKEGTLHQYLVSLQREMIGANTLIEFFQYDDRYTQLLCILQYMIDNPGMDNRTIKSDVFRAIDIVKRLKGKYTGMAR